MDYPSSTILSYLSWSSPTWVYINWLLYDYMNIFAYNIIYSYLYLIYIIHIYIYNNLANQLPCSPIVCRVSKIDHCCWWFLVLFCRRSLGHPMQSPMSCWSLAAISQPVPANVQMKRCPRETKFHIWMLLGRPKSSLVKSLKKKLHLGLFPFVPRILDLKMQLNFQHFLRMPWIRDKKRCKLNYPTSKKHRKQYLKKHMLIIKYYRCLWHYIAYNTVF